MTQSTSEAARPEAPGASRQGTIVFVHGYMDGPQVWQRTVDALSLPGWDMHLCHLHRAGAGAHGSTSSETTLDAYATQVVASVEATCAALGRVVLVGHSMGGQVAELAARRWEGCLAGLVLVTPAPLVGTPLAPEIMARFRSRIGLADPVAIGQGKRAMGSGLDDAAVDVLVRATLATSSDTALEQLLAWTGGHSAGAQASLVQAPVLTIATDDKFFTAEMLERYATRFPRYIVRKIAGAGHWPQLEQPQALARALETFVRELPAQG